MKKRVLSAVAAVVALTCAVAAPPATAANWTVDTIDDGFDANQALAEAADGVCDVNGPDTTCSLRAALFEADSNGESDQITISVPGTITLGPEPNFGTLVIGLSNIGTTTIQGAAGGTTVLGANPFRVFNISADVTLRDLTVRGGIVQNSAGAGIRHNSGLLTLERVTVTQNFMQTIGGSGGAGIASMTSDAVLVIRDSTIAGNGVTDDGGTQGDGGAGGGILASGPLTIARSTITENAASSGDLAGEGGGIRAVLGSDPYEVEITNSTISGNFAGGDATNGGGAGISIGAGVDATIVGSTVTGNEALGHGGGIKIPSTADTHVTRNTIYAANESAVTPFANTEQCDAVFDAEEHNIDSGDGCAFSPANGSLSDVMAGELALGPLASNGGPTQTQAIGAGSVARNAAPDCNGLTTDQRGTARPQESACDIGAYEYVAPAVPPVNNPVDPKKCKKGFVLKKGKCVRKCKKGFRLKKVKKKGKPVREKCVRAKKKRKQRK